MMGVLLFLFCFIFIVMYLDDFTYYDALTYFIPESE
jgi:hypothetical protein